MGAPSCRGAAVAERRHSGRRPTSRMAKRQQHRHDGEVTTAISRANDPHDFLDLDALLDDEERLVRDTVRSFVVDRVLPDIGDWFEAGTFPVEMAKEMGALGLLGMHLDGYGCAGTNAVSYGLACQELEAGDSGFRSFVS